MKLTLPRQTLVTTLQAVQASSAGGSEDAALPFANVRLSLEEDGCVELSSASMESAAKKRFDNNVKVEGEMNPFAVNLKRLLDAARLLPGDEITIDVTDKSAMLRGRNGSVRLPLYDTPDAVVDIWKIEPQGPGLLDVNPARLRHAIEAVSHAMDRDTSSPAMMGICLDIKPSELHVVATNGARMAVERIECEFGAPQPDVHFVIQPAATDAIQDMLEAFTGEKVSVDITAEVFLARSEDGRVAVRIIGSSMPYAPWEQVASLKAQSSVTVKADEVLSILRRAVAITGTRPGVTLSLDPERKVLAIVSEETERGSTDGSVPWSATEGDPIGPIVVSPRFLADAIESFGDVSDIVIAFGLIGGRPSGLIVTTPAKKDSTRFVTRMAK